MALPKFKLSPSLGGPGKTSSKVSGTVIAAAEIGGAAALSSWLSGKFGGPEGHKIAGKVPTELAAGGALVILGLVAPQEIGDHMVAVGIGAAAGYGVRLAWAKGFQSPGKVSGRGPYLVGAGSADPDFQQALGVLDQYNARNR